MALVLGDVVDDDIEEDSDSDFHSGITHSISVG